MLITDNGEKVYFEFLDLILYRSKEYVVLLPDFEGADEVTILQVEELDEVTEIYTSIDDPRMVDIVFELFKERNQDFFDFID